MGKHSFLSASASHRWINCPPSARLCEEYADRPSEYAQEGTDCHELCAYKVEKALGRRVKDPTENLTYYSQEMEDCADGYCAFVMEEVAKARERCADPLVLVEQRLDYSRYVGIEGSFGTGDCVIVSDGLLHIIDYKHGLGVLVSAEKNSQLSCYALGALDLFDGIYDIAQVSLTIYQPRRENVSTYTMSREELLAWAKTVLAPAAKLAYEGKGEFKAGDHCQFCKAKANCRKPVSYTHLTPTAANGRSITWNWHGMTSRCPRSWGMRRLPLFLPRRTSWSPGLETLRITPCRKPCPGRSLQDSKWWRAAPTGSTPMRVQSQKQSRLPVMNPMRRNCWASRP